MLYSRSSYWNYHVQDLADLNWNISCSFKGNNDSRRAALRAFPSNGTSATTCHRNSMTAETLTWLPTQGTVMRLAAGRDNVGEQSYGGKKYVGKYGCVIVFLPLGSLLVHLDTELVRYIN